MANEEILNEEIVNETPAETPVETPAATVEEPVLEEKRYEYQPTDADGRPIGGKQVIKYRTQEELVFKLTEQSNHQIRKMREQERKLRLGILDQDTIDESAPRIQAPQEFKKRVLTPEERVQLSQDILDPENFDRAIETVFEASIGTSPDSLTKTITGLQADNAAIKAQRESDIFMARNPDFIRCPENAQAIANWIQRYGLAPVADNFQKAYNTLKEAGVLVTSLEVIPEPTYEVPAPPPAAVVPPVEEPKVDEPPAREEIPVENQVPPETPPAQKPQSRVPTGLNNSNSSNAGASRPLADEIVYEFVQKDGQGRQVGEKRVFKGLAAINAMPGDEYKRRLLTEPGFAKKVEKLEQEAAAKKRRG